MCGAILSNSNPLLDDSRRCGGRAGNRICFVYSMPINYKRSSLELIARASTDYKRLSAASYARVSLLRVRGRRIRSCGRRAADEPALARAYSKSRGWTSRAAILRVGSIGQVCGRKLVCRRAAACAAARLARSPYAQSYAWQNSGASCPFRPLQVGRTPSDDSARMPVLEVVCAKHFAARSTHS
jgi:hypothetical protein